MDDFNIYRSFLCFFFIIIITGYYFAVLFLSLYLIFFCYQICALISFHFLFVTTCYIRHCMYIYIIFLHTFCIVLLADSILHIFLWLFVMKWNTSYIRYIYKIYINEVGAELARFFDMCAMHFFVRISKPHRSRSTERHKISSE